MTSAGSDSSHEGGWGGLSEETLAHLQRATLELISAARTVLDAAEEALREPGGLAAVVSDTVNGLVGAISEVGPEVLDRLRSAGAGGAARWSGASGDGPGDEPRVQHIRVD